MPKWNEIVSAKVNSFENFHYRPHGNNFKVMIFFIFKTLIKFQVLLCIKFNYMFDIILYGFK